ncbi:Dyp-type peroxidase family [Arthrobacter sp. B3I9]|uniref:Dyp-type peroxidase n=1 Tax=Arthrobacter sp. B3I9 TaxID=3042270 RepID=UPI002791DEFC|nr:Dyp-type peroxidase [Arthrobacter sp. B3I9]MDQ0850508.1 Dyp-type peroxidase family [Arthrobacter sp. B3I9]
MAGPPLNPSPSPDLSDLQGLLRSGYTSLPHARFCLYTAAGRSSGRAFLAALHPIVTSAAEREVKVVTQVAMTASCLKQLSVSDDVIAQFPLEFLEGMATAERSVFLGDVGDQDPANWAWGGPGNPRVDLLVMTYAPSADRLEAACTQVDALAETHQLSMAGVLTTSPWSTEEPFGFRDGISQPRLDEFASTARRAQEGLFSAPRPVAIGEFVLGYPNEYGHLTERPMVLRASDPDRLLPDDPSGSGEADLGRNGTYLVLRTLRQSVDEFWAYARQASGGDPVAATALAAKMVGRWPSGAPLALASDQDRPELAQSNDFGYHAHDRLGLSCPIGAHIRRANPRDALDPRPGSAESLAVTDRHRLLRRGRNYGPVKDGGAPGNERGLQFIALVANLSRQFEFVQHTWLDSTKFDGLYEDVDPVTGTRGPGASTFTVPGTPFRNRYLDVPSFVTTRGGAYFFLPGIRALNYLANGP